MHLWKPSLHLPPLRDVRERHLHLPGHPSQGGYPMTAPMLFKLVRDQDVSGVSGVGEVADGVIWPDGTVSVRWRGEHPSVVFWRSLESVKVIHGHHGATRIVLPSSERERLGRIADAHSKDVIDHGMTSGLCVECGHLWPCPSYVWATTGRESMACWDPRDDEPEPAGQPGEAGTR